MDETPIFDMVYRRYSTINELIPVITATGTQLSSKQTKRKKQWCATSKTINIVMGISRSRFRNFCNLTIQ
jgi:hypothetical protein